MAQYKLMSNRHLVEGVKSSLLAPYGSIGVELGVLAFLITLVFIDIYIAHPGIISTRVHALYITGTTILATMIAKYVSGQTRVLWLENIGNDPSHWTNILLAVGKFRDQFRFCSITVSFLITGLTTTAIVAGITPSTSIITLGSLYTLFPGDDCCSFVDSTPSNGS